jgi:hypothetical protein
MPGRTGRSNRRAAERRWHCAVAMSESKILLETTDRWGCQDGKIPPLMRGCVGLPAQGFHLGPGRLRQSARWVALQGQAHRVGTLTLLNRRWECKKRLVEVGSTLLISPLFFCGRPSGYGFTAPTHHVSGTRPARPRTHQRAACLGTVTPAERARTPLRL